MAADFITLADAQGLIDVPSDPVSDLRLSWAIATVTQGIIDLLDRDPRVQTRMEFYNGTGSYVLPVTGYPIQNVSLLLVDLGAVDLTQLYWDDYLVYLRGGLFPRGRKNIQITYIAGLDPLPMPIRMAAVMWTKAIWSGIEADQNAANESYNGVMSQSFRPDGPGSCPPQAHALLRPYIQRYRIS